MTSALLCSTAEASSKSTAHKRKRKRHCDPQRLQAAGRPGFITGAVSIFHSTTIEADMTPSILSQIETLGFVAAPEGSTIEIAFESDGSYIRGWSAVRVDASPLAGWITITTREGCQHDLNLSHVRSIGIRLKCWDESYTV